MTDPHLGYFRSMAMCSSHGLAEVDTRAVDEEAIRVLPKLATLAAENQELLLALAEGDTDQQLAEYFTNGKERVVRARIALVLFHQLGLDPSVPTDEAIKILRRAFTLAGVAVQ